MSKAPPPPFPPPTEVPTLGYPSPPPAKPKPTSQTTSKFEALQRVDAAHLLVSASGHSFDDAMLIVAALENDGVFIVRGVASDA